MIRMIQRTGFERASSLLKLLSHPDRLQILFFVEGKEEKVTTIQRHIGLTQAMTSQHLKVLHDTGYLNRRRSGTSIYYALSKKQGSKILPAIKNCEEFWNGSPVNRQN